MTVITVERLRLFHGEAITRYGGSKNAVEKASGCLERSIAATVNRCLYEEDCGEDDALQLAAGLLFYLAKNHCMEDGNKRLAWTAAMDVLLRRGLTLQVSKDTAAEFVLRLAAGEVEGPADVANWMAEYIEEAPSPATAPDNPVSASVS